MPCASLRKSCFLEPLGKFNRNHPTFPRSKARWRASERRIVLRAISEQYQKAGFLPEPALMAGRTCSIVPFPPIN